MRGGAGIARAGTFYWVNSDNSFSHDHAWDSTSSSGSAYLWSSWLKDGTNMAIMKVSKSGVTSDDSYTRKYGASIRCVVKFDMQEFNTLTPAEKTVVLGSMETGKNYTFNDSRDGRSYTVAKLKDGNVWMTENLNLGATAVATTINLDSSNTNINFVVPAATFNGWKGTATTENNYTTGRYIALPKTTYGTDETSLTQYGTLYNFFAVSAGAIKTDTNPYDATVDICPAGWRLPKGGTSGEFGTLYNKYNSFALMRGSIASGGAAFSLPGIFIEVIQNEHERAWYWSSTRLGGVTMHSMSIIQRYNDPSNGTVDPVDDWGGRRDKGNPVRCILKPVSETTKNGAWWYSP